MSAQSKPSIVFANGQRGGVRGSVQAGRATAMPEQRSERPAGDGDPAGARAGVDHCVTNSPWDAAPVRSRIA